MRFDESKASFGVCFRKQFNFLFRGQRDIRGDEVGEYAGRRNSLNEGFPFVGHILAEPDNSLREHHDTSPCRFELRRGLVVFDEGPNLHSQGRLRGDGAGHDRTSDAYDERLLTFASGVDDAHDTNDRADLVEIFECGILGHRIALGYDEHKAVLTRVIQGCEGACAPNRQRHRHAGINDHVSDREHGQDRRHLDDIGAGDFHDQGGDITRASLAVAFTLAGIVVVAFFVGHGTPVLPRFGLGRCGAPGSPRSASQRKQRRVEVNRVKGGVGQNDRNEHERIGIPQVIVNIDETRGSRRLSCGR